jgi:hypothetical protein
VILNKSQKTIIKYNFSSTGNTMWNLSLNFTFCYKIDLINMKNILISLKITIPPVHIYKHIFPNLKYPLQVSDVPPGVRIPHVGNHCPKDWDLF